MRISKTIIKRCIEASDQEVYVKLIQAYMRGELPDFLYSTLELGFKNLLARNPINFILVAHAHAYFTRELSAPNLHALVHAAWSKIPAKTYINIFRSEKILVDELAARRMLSTIRLDPENESMTRDFCYILIHYFNTHGAWPFSQSNHTRAAFAVLLKNISTFSELDESMVDLVFTQDAANWTAAALEIPINSRAHLLLIPLLDRDDADILEKLLNILPKGYYDVHTHRLFIRLALERESLQFAMEMYRGAANPMEYYVLFSRLDPAGAAYTKLRRKLTLSLGYARAALGTHKLLGEKDTIPLIAAFLHE